MHLELEQLRVIRVARDYLALPNVACVGGSWMVPRAWLQAGDWQRVTDSAARARTLATPLSS